MHALELVWLSASIISLLSVAKTSVENSEFIEHELISGLAASRLKFRSRIYCSSLCLLDMRCKAYTYRPHEAENCILIHRSGAKEGITFVTDEPSLLYVKGELIIGREYMRELAVVHRDFESGLTENGAQAVDGKVNKAVRTDLSQRTWVNLGNLSSVACIIIPESCGSAGGALSIWIRILECPQNAGIITSCDDNDEGLIFSCSSNKLGYNVIFSNRAVWATTSIPIEWFHLVLNFYGPNLSKDWFAIYHNGVDMKVDVNPSSPNDFSAGQGVMAIGRYRALTDREYSSVIVDEMMLFNRKLTLDEIQILYRINA